MSNELEKLVLTISATHDEDAFKELCQKMRPIILRVYHSYTFFYMEKEDFIQEAEWELLEICDHYNPNHSYASFFGYYHACLTWLAIKFVRQEHKKSVIPPNMQVNIDRLERTTLQQLAVLPESTPELSEKTEEYFQHLSKRERKVLDSWLDGNTLSEMEQQLSLSHQQVISAFNRCRQKFIQYVIKG